MSPKKLPMNRNLLSAEIIQRLYIQDPPQTQSDIAKSLGIEKSTVSRLLAEAREKKLFSVTLNLPRDQKLELDLNRAYGIQAVVEPIFETRSQKGWQTFTCLLAESAAQHLEGPASPLQSGQRIALACGATMRDLVNALTPGTLSKMSFSQLTVETLVEEIVDQSPFTLITTLYGKWREDSSVYAINPLPGTLRDDGGAYTPAYKPCRDKLIEQFEVLDVAILGIGLCRLGAGDGFAYICEKAGVSREELMRNNPVGEILNCPFDKNGKSLIADLPKLGQVVDSVGPDRLQEMVSKNKKVIAIAGGAKKVQTIRVAIETGLINYLITDHTTAKSLLAKTN